MPKNHDSDAAARDSATDQSSADQQWNQADQLADHRCRGMVDLSWNLSLGKGWP